jgi:transcriptional regulator with XRE-family HTH domain
MKTYRNIRELLKDYRQDKIISQDTLSDILGVSERTIRRWETDKNSVMLENEFAITEKLKIPFFVVHNLNVEIPISYNIKTRRYSLSEFSKELLDKNLLFQAVDNKLDRIKKIDNFREIESILSYDHTIYNTDRPVKKSLLRTASEYLPELNLFAKDYFGYYAGHLVTLPIKMESYQDLRKSLISEGDLSSNDLSGNQNIALYVYSVYCDCTDTCILLFKKTIRELNLLRNSKFPPETIISGYAVTKDGAELANKLNFEKVFDDKDEQERYHTEFIPTFYETTLEKIRINTP